MLFVSYAAEDSEVATEVVNWLSEHGHADVYTWRTERMRPTSDRIEERISQADDFIALVSPNFLADPLCRRERELAAGRERGLRLTYPYAPFVHLLLVGEIEESADGLPSGDEWLEATSPASKEDALNRLLGRLGSMVQARGTAAANPGPGSVLFRNRSDELEIAARGLKNFGGPHFWLVIAPPQLGKTWFVDRLTALLLLEDPEPWVVRLVDVRDQKAEARANVGSLLRSLFGPDCPNKQEPDTYITIARKIIVSRRRHVCVIDSAELLTEDTARALRRCLSEIHNRVSEAGLPEARLAVVVASRRDAEWRGITPDPRLSIMNLTEFSVDVVEDALRALALEMGHSFESSTMARHARHVHKLSEGLPALLAHCIAWIREQNWTGMERLGYPSLFADLAHPYIKNNLLARESLFPPSQGRAEPHNGGQAARAQALEDALRGLAPYRLFTQSHLLHYHDLDSGLSASMTQLGWTVQDLWRAISLSALLVRPLDEPWQEIPAAMRRLLYRYHYVTDDERAAAHREAHSFTAVWADQQRGKEQIVGLVECLWHEAAVLRLERPLDLEGELLASARVLSRSLRGSLAYTEGELRDFAAERTSRDEEFREAVGDELHSKIITAVRSPDPE